MDDDLRPAEFPKNYPTAGCLIGCAVAGLILLAIALPIAYYLFTLYLSGISNA